MSNSNDYIKQEWNEYDDNLSLEDNIKRHAVIIPQYMMHIEEGVYSANKNKQSISEVVLNPVSSDENASATITQDGKLVLCIPIPVGEKGEVGPKGDKGDKGEQGEVGPAGQDGLPGEQGPQGPIGPKGDKGDKGDTGDTGPAGPQGEPGPAGPQGLTGGTGTWFEIINAACTDTDDASTHTRNGIYRGKNLTSLGIDEILRRIRNNFEDLFIGDYFDATINTTYTANETVRNIIAGFNSFLNSGDNTKLLTPHVVIVPKNTFAVASYMNSTNTTAGGYKGSYMYTTVLPIYATALNAALKNSLLTRRAMITTAIDADSPSTIGNAYNGAASAFEWVDLDIALLTEAQVFGSDFFSSSALDSGIDCMQFPLFSLKNNTRIASRGGTDDVIDGGNHIWYWLRNISSSATFCTVGNNGRTAYNNASFNNGGVRPFYIIG